MDGDGERETGLEKDAVVPGPGGVVLPAQRSAETSLDAESPGGGQRGLWLELLVHGIGGTTPEAMLDDPHLKQMTGDAMSGTYRRWPDQDAERRPAGYSGDAVLEAYSWAKLTSGAASRALWLLLLPFMFANLAHWMRPPGRDGDDTRGRGAYQALVKLVAVSLTVLLTAAACEIALDLTAWQCAADSACVAHHSWLVFALGGHGGWWAQPGRRLAVAALVPVAVLTGLGRLARLTWSSYEMVRPMPGARPAVRPLEMEGDGFWYGVAAVARLRALHLAAGLLTIAWAVLIPVLAHDRAAGAGLRWVGLALLAALVVLGALLLVGLALGWDALPGRAHFWAAAGAVALVCVYAVWSRPDWTATGLLPGAQRGFAALAAGQALLVLVLGGVAWWMTRGQPPAAPVDPTLTLPGPDGARPADSGFGGANGAAMRGLGGPVTSMLAVGLGGFFTAGGVLFAAQRLAGGGAVPQAAPMLVWHASGITLLVPALLVIVAVVGLGLVRRSWALRPQVLAAYDKPATTHSPRTGAIATALSGARATEAGAALIATLAGVSAVLLLASLVGSLATGRSLTDATHGEGAFLAGLGQTLQHLGGWLTTAMVVALIGLGRSAYRSPSQRRSVGMLWDIGTFWPRAAHPLAPPCYAERAVPDIEARMRTWLGADPTRRLVLSAHSQGTVLAAAALWQLDPATRGRVALLTYGSPLRRLYGRFFPAYMGPDQLGRLLGDVPRWDNLFRLTDPIGGPVRLAGADGAPGPDQPPFPDPLAFGRTDAYPILVPVNGHSDYRADPRFIEARDALLQHLGSTP
ncbi:hypothetical protein [Streptacidiphilus rugosus]|uniref:hypothetical protein n=1 Tax=Streptacidiphilus rugosus TaxID=405783 RepID=UPI00068AB52C|nr:hypothetical protein [Streptacidiphilus rugosus]